MRKMSDREVTQIQRDQALIHELTLILGEAWNTLEEPKDGRPTNSIDKVAEAG